MRNRAIALIITAVIVVSTGCGISGPTPVGNKAATTPNTNTTATHASNTSNAAATTSNTWVNIPGLANKTPEEIESALGKATDISPVTEPPQEMPGENRTYDLADMKGALIIQFYKGKAAAFTLNVPKGKELKTADELGKMTGFEVTGKTPEKATDFVSQWNGQFGPAKFAEVTIGKGPKSDYNLIRARIQR